VTRSCTVCSHENINEINKLLLSNEAYRSVAKQFNISESAVFRHKKNCLVEDQADVLHTMQRAREEALREVHAQELEVIKEHAADTISARLSQAKNFFEQLSILRERASMALEKAEQAEDQKTVLLACRELRDTIRIWAELEGRFPQPQVNIALVSSPEWIELRSKIFAALLPYPQAREAILEALDE